MTRIYGIPYKRIIGKREIAIAPDTHIFVKKKLKNTKVGFGK